MCVDVLSVFYIFVSCLQPNVTDQREENLLLFGASLLALRRNNLNRMLYEKDFLYRLLYS